MRRSDTPLFAALDSHSRFHRDGALGRILHPGTRSYRERSTFDSVHVAVSPDNRLSVHVDRVSPLVIRAGRRCRYSVGRALVHNAFALAEAVGRLVRREHGGQRCHLDCEVVWVPDDDGVEADDDGHGHQAESALAVG